MHEEAFKAAYRATTYRVTLDDTAYVIRIDERHPRLDSWLATAGFSRWVWLTAVNPGSRSLSDADNAARLASLETRLASDGWRFHPGTAVADGGDWAPEPSLFVPGLDPQTGSGLAERYGQNAFLAGQLGEAAVLCWVGKPLPR